jgi:hypothetical protein
MAMVGFALGCSNSGGGGTDASPDATDAGVRHCTGVGAVCGSGPGFACAEQFTTDDCYQKQCCILAPDGGPPYYDDAGTCPGICASPDDIGCANWYRGCQSGTLCCVMSAAADASTD